MKPSEHFEEHFTSNLQILREDQSRPEQKRNKTGNLWKKSLAYALEKSGFDVVIEETHKINVDGVFFDKMKSDIAIYKNGLLIAIFESKDYFSIDYIRRACFELNEICGSYENDVKGYLFMGRLAMKNTERLERWLNRFNLKCVRMVDEVRCGGKKMKTVVDTDFDVCYNRVDDLVEELNALSL